MLSMFVAYWAGLYAWNGMPSSERRRVFQIVFLVFVVNLVDQFRLFRYTPGLKTTFAKTGMYGQLNLGATNFICTAMVFALFFLADVVNGHPNNSKGKLALYVSLVGLILYYFVTFAQSATITFCFFVTALLFLICGNEPPRSRIWAHRLIGYGLVFFVFFFLLPPIFSWAIDVLAPVAGSKILARLQTIQHLVSDQVNTEDMMSLRRGTLISMDFDAWLSSPSSFFMGRGYHYVSALGVLEVAEQTGAGNHSGFVDLLPRYGLFGLVAMIALTVTLWKYFLDGCDQRCAVKLKIFMVMLIFYNVANKLFHTNVIFSIMFLLPFLRQKPGSGSLPPREVWQGKAVTTRPGEKPVPPAPSLLPLSKEKR